MNTIINHQHSGIQSETWRVVNWFVYTEKELVAVEKQTCHDQIEDVSLVKSMTHNQETYLKALLKEDEVKEVC